MTNILLMLLLPVIRVQLKSAFPSCPASCAVCSDDAVICQRLAQIIDAPDSTQALLLTDGSISTVQPASLSDLSNITVIGLSHNQISELNKEAFTHLPFLHTLLLDHNLLTSQALQGGALTNLSQLQVLALGHNHITMGSCSPILSCMVALDLCIAVQIEAAWFGGAKALRSLKLEGNLLTSLDSASFSMNDLRDLDSLDLSDNLIKHIDSNSFRGLVSLKTLDLSRNHLSSAPADAFSYLNWLTNLNLDLNSWNCSCQLLELAAFLSTFIQQPDKTLYNGRRMVCVSADNPAVTTVLELTDANCVPSNQNITVRLESRGSVTPQLYARDLAITAVICFIGGVGLTLLVVLIFYQLRKRRKLKESQRLTEEGGSSITANHVGAERRIFEDKINQQWTKDAVPLESRTDGYARSRTEDSNGYFTCVDCSTDDPRSFRRDVRMNGGIETEEARERRRMRMMMEEERRRKLLQMGNFQSDASLKFKIQSNNSHPQRDASNLRNDALPPYRTARTVENQRIDRGFETLHCESCHKMFRAPDQNARQGRTSSNIRDAGFPPQHRLNEGARNGNHLFDTMRNTDFRREAKNVTFDLESRSSQEKQARETSTPRHKEKAREKRNKGQSSRLLKVKLNLNPLKKSKIHPKKKGEQQGEKSSPRKSKEKRREGKEADESERRMRKSKHSGEKTKKENCVEVEDGEEEKSKASSEQKDKEITENNVSENTQPEISTESGKAAELSVSAVVPGQSVSALGSAQLLSQHPFSLLAADRNRTTNLPLLTPAGSQLTGSSISLQGGNFLLNSMASATSTLLPGGTAANPSLGLSGPSMVPSGAPNSFNRQAGLGLTNSVPSILANPSVSQAASFQGSQTVGLPLTLATSASSIQSLSQKQLLTESSSLKPDPEQESGPPQQTGESKATKENLPVQTLTHISEVTHLNPEAVSTMENVSNNNSQTDTACIPAVSMVTALSGGVVTSEAPSAGVSVTNVSALSSPMQSETSIGAALLQQEYLPEEGGTSPRRKLRLVIPEKTSSRPPTALERKIR